MIRFSYQDLIGELIETCHDYIRESYQQIHYYNASVYKTEIVHNLDKKIEALRTIAFFINHECLQEPLHDYDSKANSTGNSIHIEQSSLPARATKLMIELTKGLQEYSQLLEDNRITIAERDLNFLLKKQKRRLISVCRRGTRSWALLQTL